MSKGTLERWKYLGYTKEILARHEEDIATDNLRILRNSLGFVTAILILEVIVIFLINMSAGEPNGIYTNSMWVLVGSSCMNFALIIICRRTERIKNKKQLARVLTTTTLALWYLLCIAICTMFDDKPAILMCGMILLEQVMFDSYPADNLLFASVTYAVFLAASYMMKPMSTVMMNIIYTLPFLLVGNYLSWAKSRGKWSALINQDSGEKARAQEMEKNVAKAQLTVMLSQLQPHFLFNALGSIAYLCDEDPEQARTATLLFSDYLRGNIEALKAADPIPFAKELAHLQTYLALEKLRFENKLTVVYDIRATDFFIPAVTVLSLAENAVCHGVCASEDGGTIRITSYELPDCFEIVVSDNGVGFCPEETAQGAGAHGGINDARIRLTSLVGGTLRIQSAKGSGTAATVQIPKGGIAHAHSGCR